jgi:hypothetical protein
MDTKSHTRQIIVVVVWVTAIVLSTQVDAQSPRMAVTSSGEIISGGPTLEEAKKALEGRISQQSEGEVLVLNFQPTKTKMANVDLKGKSYCEFGFEAQVEFTEPSRWAVRYDGKPLTFNLLKTNQLSTVLTSMPGDVITVSNKGERYAVFGTVWFTPSTNGWIPSGFASSGQPKLYSALADERCVLNLRSISAAFAGYEIEHNGKNPFNISTNSGGTMELCSRDADGCDKNSVAHYRVMSNFFNNATVLVCPADSSKTAIRNFQSLSETMKYFEKLTATNVTYLLHSSVDIDNTGQPHQILAVCPIHGYVVYTDGEIEKK